MITSIQNTNTLFILRAASNDTQSRSHHPYNNNTQKNHPISNTFISITTIDSTETPKEAIDDKSQPNRSLTALKLKLFKSEHTNQDKTENTTDSTYAKLNRDIISLLSH